MAFHTIDEFMNKIGRQRGMSLTTGFDVFIDFPSSNTMDNPYYKNGNEDIDKAIHYCELLKELK